MSQTQILSFSPTEPPIGKLPDSILSDIFITAKSAVTSLEEKRLAPYSLASVCHRWRTIALSVSALWDFVDLLFRPKHIAIHVARSRHVSMHMLLDIFCDNVNITTLQAIFNTLGADIWARTRELVILLDYERQKTSRLVLDTLNNAIGASHAGVFEEITLCVCVDHCDPDDLKPTNSLCLHLPNSTTIRSICLEQVDLPLKHLVHTSSLPALSHLELKRIHIHMTDLLFPVLNLASNLVELLLDNCNFWLDLDQPNLKPPPAHSIVLSKLEKLVLHRVDGIFVGVVLRVLDMPSLQFLELGVHFIVPKAMQPMIDTPWEYILPCYKIEILKLQGFTSSPLGNLFEQIHRLEHLKELEMMYESDRELAGFVENLAISLSDGSCCPLLENITLPSNWYVDEEGCKTLAGLKGARPSLHIWANDGEIDTDLEEEGEEESEEESEDEGDGSEADSGGGQISNRTNVDQRMYNILDYHDQYSTNISFIFSEQSNRRFS